MRTKTLALTSLAVAALAVLWSMTWDRGQASALIDYRNPEATAAGAAIYAENCAACHGAALEGETPDWRNPGPDGLLPAPPHDDSGHTWHHPDELLFRITKFGSEAVVGRGYRSNMLGFGNVLSDAEILDVLAYIKSTWSSRVQAAHDEINERASQ